MSTSDVYLREEARTVRVSNGADKPEPPAAVVAKWQRLVDLLAEIFSVPASLIMRMTTSEMRVFLTSDSIDNPYPADGTDELGHGLYCETVIGRREPLHVVDARADHRWADNPDVRLNMISYVGHPLTWPDGSVFGTICCLDSKPRSYSRSLNELLVVFREIIELDLRQIVELEHLRDTNIDLENSVREMSHRLKNNLNSVLSFMQLKRDYSGADLDSIFADVENRIHAISSLHERIAYAGDRRPDAEGYLTELVEHSLRAVGREAVAATVSVDPLDLGRHLMEIGAVVVELIGNSAKYAFPVTSAPSIELTLRRENDTVTLAYTDNGPGVPLDSSPGLGLLLCESSAQKLKGTLTIEGRPRNQFRLQFPLPA